MANSVVGIFFSVILVAQGKSDASLASRLWTCLKPSLTIESNMEHVDVNDETCEVKRALGPLFQLSDLEKSVTETKSLVYTLRAVADGDSDQEFPETIKDPIRRWMLNVGIVLVMIDGIGRNCWLGWQPFGCLGWFSLSSSYGPWLYFQASSYFCWKLPWWWQDPSCFKPSPIARWTAQYGFAFRFLAVIVPSHPHQFLLASIIRHFMGKAAPFSVDWAQG